MTVGRSTSPTHQQGARAEDAAWVFLQQQGFELVAQNFHTRYGELDIVVRQARLLVFVEVKQRKQHALVSAAESITPAKQRKIIHSAMIFLQQHPHYTNDDCRFDVLALTTRASQQGMADQPDGAYHIEWIKAAFAL